jgi:PPM family protein phosphatase
MRSHPQRSELLSALGVGEHELQVSVSQEPWALQPGDVFLLCTDGLWEYVLEAELEATLAVARSPNAWLDALEQRVLAAAARKPRHDNFSALAVWVSNPMP